MLEVGVARGFGVRQDRQDDMLRLGQRGNVARACGWGGLWMRCSADVRSGCWRRCAKIPVLRVLLSDWKTGAIDTIKSTVYCVDRFVSVCVGLYSATVCPV